MLAVAMVATLAASPAPAAAPCTNPPQTFPTSQMTRGMTGVGYTVLEGDTIVPFDVEVLGVMPNAIYLGVDIVAAKLTGPADFLDTTGGAVAGMSGSPIYLNGKLAGALAWRIADDRQIFGMTAAEDMVGIFSLPGAADSGSLPDRIPLTPEVRRAATAAGSPLAPGAVLEALPVPLGVSGMNGVPLSEIERSFADRGMRVQPFRASPVTAPTAISLDPTPFEPGGGLGVALSYGDVSYYGFGTTTAVCGDIALGFGHPMFWGVGRVSLGMNEVDVIAIDDGAFGGTKIGILGDAHGTLTQDRFAGVAGVFGQLPTLVPITSDVSSVETGLSRHGETQVAWDDDFFFADATYSHSYSNFTYVAQEDAPGTLELAWAITGTREDGSPFTVTNRSMGYNTYGAAGETYPMVDALYQLAGNGFEDVAFTGVDMTGVITEANLIAQIVGVRTSSPLQPELADRPVVRAHPGDAITIEVTLDPFEEGPNVVATMTFVVPENARSTQEIVLRGGRGRFNYRQQIDNLDQLIEVLNGGDHQNDLIAKGFRSTVTQIQDVIVRGKVRLGVQIVR